MLAIWMWVWAYQPRRIQKWGVLNLEVCAQPFFGCSRQWMQRCGIAGGAYGLQHNRYNFGPVIPFLLSLYSFSLSTSFLCLIFCLVPGVHQRISALAVPPRGVAAFSAALFRCGTPVVPQTAECVLGGFTVMRKKRLG